MPKAFTYTAREHLSDGNEVEIRALQPDDETDMLAAVERTSEQSRQRRFFAMKRYFSEKERDFFMDIDFKNHVALVALAPENGRPVIVGAVVTLFLSPDGPRWRSSSSMLGKDVGSARC